MASERKRVRYTIDVTLPNQEAKDSFKAKLESIRDLLSPQDGPKLDNLALMTALFALAEGNYEGDAPSRPAVPGQSTEHLAASGCFLPSSGESKIIKSYYLSF